MMNISRGSRFGMPPVVWYLVVANVVMWVVMLFAERLHSAGLTAVVNSLMLFPVGSPFFHWWQPITYMFLHGGFVHLFFNMFMLWMFGRFIEQDLGSRRFLIYYMVCGVGAGLLQLLVGWFTGASPFIPTVGASGAIYGILLAFGMLHPNDIIMPLIPPIPMKAKWAVLIFGGLELLLGILSSRGTTADSVAHFAHLGGMLWGFLLLMWWRYRAKNRMQSRY